MALNNNTQSRKWQLTINNPKEHNLGHEELKEILSTLKLEYWCMCDEIGDNGTYHTHIFIYSKSPKKFSTIKNKLPIAHIEACKGKASQNREYIRKEGKYKDTDKAHTNLIDTFEEWGEMPNEQQGKRNDIESVYNLLKQDISPMEIIEKMPNQAYNINRMEKLREALTREKFCNINRELEVTYIEGQTGVGKSHYVREQYGNDLFVVSDYKHPFDNYNYQNVICFEEFHSQIRLPAMLQFLDKYPIELPARYSNKTACYTKVLIISNKSVFDQYSYEKNNSPETWRAFLRRIHKHIEFTGFNEYTIDEKFNKVLTKYR